VLKLTETIRNGRKMNHQVFLTIAEVSQMLRVSERSIYKMAIEGRLPGAAKVGGQWRVERITLERWIRAGGDAGRSGTGTEGVDR
jgi:excisionase family DNA binding protein